MHSVSKNNIEIIKVETKTKISEIIETARVRTENTTEMH